MLALILSSGTLAAESGMSEAELLAGADERIEKHRQADAVVAVVDAAGQPVAGVEVKIEQQRHAFLFGCNIFKWGRLGNERDEAAYRSRFAELLNYATLPFYWGSYERQRGRPDHAHTEQVARWCRDQRIITKGHPLAWNTADPRWLPDDFGQIFTLQLARIDDCVGRFKGLIDRWDVVNEATHFERDSFWQRAPKLTGMWQHVGRVKFVQACFADARKAHPQATLLINDYRTDPACEALLKQLVDQHGRQIFDVIGIQSHMHGGTWSNRKIWDVCERFAKFGVPLHFTETTIISGKRGWNLGGRRRDWPSTPEGEQRQADAVERFYKMLFSHPAVEALTWWDFADRGAWQGAPAGFLRKDLSPKPAYERLLGLIKDKWWTQTTVTTDAQGHAPFRGFLGDYQITVTAQDKPSVTKPMTAQKGRVNRLVVALP